MKKTPSPPTWEERVLFFIELFVYVDFYTVLQTGFFCANTHQMALNRCGERGGCACVAVQHIAKLFNQVEVAASVAVTVVTERIDFEYLFFLPEYHQFDGVVQLV